MKWRKMPGPVMRKVGGTGDQVDVAIVRNKRPGDLDLGAVQMWGARHRGGTYAISYDSAHPDFGYTASWKPAEGETVFVAERAPTFGAAERACISHSRLQ